MPETPISIDQRQPGLLDRALAIVTQVKAGEGATALLLALNVFLLLASYYLLKTVREAGVMPRCSTTSATLRFSIPLSCPARSGKTRRSGASP